MGARKLDSRAGLLGRLKFIGVLEQSLEKRPLPADPGLHRVHLTAVVHEKHAGAVSGGHLWPQSRVHQICSLEFFPGDLEKSGQALRFFRGDQNTPLAVAALAALPTGEYGAVAVAF